MRPHRTPTKQAGWLAAAMLTIGLSVILVFGAQPRPVTAAEPAKGGHPLAVSAAGSTQTVDHGTFDRLLKRFVVAGADGLNRVDYSGFRSEGLAELKRYLVELQRFDPRLLGPDEHAAYFVNLYNAATLDVALEHYPIRSIKDIKLADAAGVPQEGPWRAPLVSVAGSRLTLDEISNAVLRPTLMARDPSGHYLLNCLSIGCPNLLAEAITGERLAGQLRAAAAAFAAHPRGLAISEGKATASSLYAWYLGDFGGMAGLIAHLAAAGGPVVAGRLAGLETIGDHGYDWGLADAAR